MSEESTSTTPPPVTTGGRRLHRVLRTATVVLLAALLGAGLAGVLGVRSATARVAGSGTAVTVVWPRTTRSGLPATIDVTAAARTREGLGSPLTVSVDAGYLELFEDVAVVPAAAAERAAGGAVVFDVEVEPGERAVSIRISGRLAASARGLHRARISVGDAPPVSLSTFVWP